MVDILLGAYVPADQHDFGCRDGLIGGGSALKKARPDPVGEFVDFGQAEPSLGLMQT